MSFDNTTDRTCVTAFSNCSAFACWERDATVASRGKLYVLYVHIKESMKPFINCRFHTRFND